MRLSMRWVINNLRATSVMQQFAMLRKGKRDEMKKSTLKLGMTVIAVALFVYALVDMFLYHDNRRMALIVFVALLLGYYAAKVK